MNHVIDRGYEIQLSKSNLQSYAIEKLRSINEFEAKVKIQVIIVKNQKLLSRRSESYHVEPTCTGPIPVMPMRCSKFEKFI